MIDTQQKSYSRISGRANNAGGRSDDMPNMSNQQNETQPYQSIEPSGSNETNMGPDDLDDEIPF